MLQINQNDGFMEMCESLCVDLSSIDAEYQEEKRSIEDQRRRDHERSKRLLNTIHEQQRQVEDLISNLGRL